MRTLAAPVRVFSDSNALAEGLFALWGASQATLILARNEVFRLVLSPYVEEEGGRYLKSWRATRPKARG